MLIVTEQNLTSTFLSVNNSDILSFDSASGSFSFNDSDVARTDIAETFHSDVTVAGNLNVTGTQTFTGGTVSDSATVTNNLAVGGSTTIGSNLTIGGNLTVSGTTTTINTETIDLADNTIVLNSNATGAGSRMRVLRLNVAMIPMYHSCGMRGQTNGHSVAKH